MADSLTGNKNILKALESNAWNNISEKNLAIYNIPEFSQEPKPQTFDYS